MVFSSFVFLFSFLVLVLLMYYIVPAKMRNAVLLIFSLAFYAWGEPEYILVMLASITLNYVCGLLCDRFAESKRISRLVIISNIVLNLASLGLFKYSGFFVSNINSLFSLAIPDPGLLLPIGISFYTFQAMSYTIDVYRKTVPAEKSIVRFACYVSLFPQLIAGPIVQYKTVAEELYDRKITPESFSQGVWRFTLGLAKKVLLANQIGSVWDGIITDVQGASAVTAWIGAIAFSFQIYFDFSGYSDMAIGLGKMFGFNFLENFNYPYISKSITEFWRRWHISLGTWFREYVYIPLGGNRHGRVRQFFNLAIVWTLTGLWHGASWNFVLWGAFWAIILILEKAFMLRVLEKIPAFLAHLYSLILIIFSWVIFSIDSLSSAIDYFGAMLGKNELCDSTALYLLRSNAVLLIILALAASGIPHFFYSRLCKKNSGRFLWADSVYRAVVTALLLFVSISFVAADSYNPFLYFRF